MGGWGWRPGGAADVRSPGTSGNHRQRCQLPAAAEWVVQGMPETPSAVRLPQTLPEAYGSLVLLAVR